MLERGRWIDLHHDAGAGAVNTSGSAVAFFSGGLFLDVQMESPATLVVAGRCRHRDAAARRSPRVPGRAAAPRMARSRRLVRRD